MQPPRVTFELDAKALAAARATEILAVNPAAIGKTFALRAAAPEQDWVAAAGVDAPAPRVAVVEVLGPIAQRGDTLCGFYDGWDTIEERVTRAAADIESDAILLVIDSPGGDVAGMAESIRRMRAAVAESGKPCMAYADECATSAAYALATVADQIFMPASGITGSIGTVSVHAENSAELADKGVAVTIIRSGERKFEGSSLEPLTPEARNAKQTMVDRAARAFASLVAEKRGGDADKWLGLQGRVVLAPEAFESGLVDGVMGLDGAIERAASAAEKRMSTKDQAKKAPDYSAAIEVSQAEIDAVEVGRVAMILTGAADADGAIREIRAWQDHALKAKTQAADRERAEQEAEAKERIELVRGMVARGVVGPAKAWIVGEDGPKVGAVAEPWASMKIKQLRATAGALEAPLSRRDSEGKAPTGATPTEEQAQRAKSYGVKPESFAAAAKELQAATINGGAAAPFGG